MFFAYRKVSSISHKKCLVFCRYVIDRSSNNANSSSIFQSLKRSVCVCVNECFCVWERELESLCVCVCVWFVWVYVSVCACMCVRVWELQNVCVFVRMYVMWESVFVCDCVTACVRENNFLSTPTLLLILAHFCYKKPL